MLVFFFILSSLLCPVILHSVLLNLISKPVIFHIFLLPQARPKTSWSWWPACWQLTDSLEAPSGRTHKSPRNHSGGRRRDILPEFACSLYTLETCISFYLHLVHETLPALSNLHRLGWQSAEGESCWDILVGCKTPQGSYSWEYGQVFRALTDTLEQDEQKKHQTHGRPIP